MAVLYHSVVALSCWQCCITAIVAVVAAAVAECLEEYGLLLCVVRSALAVPRGCIFSVLVFFVSVCVFFSSFLCCVSLSRSFLLVVVLRLCCSSLFGFLLLVRLCIICIFRSCPLFSFWTLVIGGELRHVIVIMYDEEFGITA